MSNFDAVTLAPLFSSLFSFCTALIALVALFIARGQLKANRDNHRETTAKATFREFLKLCVQHPDLAYGQPSQDKRDEYEWFVASFLYAAEELFEFSDGWRDNLKLHARYHKVFLATDEDFRSHDYATYSKKVQALVDEVVAEGRANALTSNS
jgi:hypothetical protein